MNPYDDLSRRFGKLGIRPAEIDQGLEMDLFQESVSRGVPDRALFEVIEAELNQLESGIVDTGFLEPPAHAGLDEGQIHILNTASGLPVCVSFDSSGVNPTNHIAVCGQVGMGKSSFQAHLASQCAGRVSSLILDVNRFYRKVPALWKNHRFILWSDLRLNPFDSIDGVDSGVVDQVMIHDFVGNYGVIYGEYEMAEIVQDIRKDGIPNWFDVLSRLKGKRYDRFTNRGRYRDSAVLTLNNMLQATGGVFKCSQGMPLSELLRNNIVLELHGLLPEHQNHLVTQIVSYLRLLGVAR